MFMFSKMRNLSLKFILDIGFVILSGVFLSKLFVITGPILSPLHKNDTDSAVSSN